MSTTTNPQSRIPNPCLYACLYRPPLSGGRDDAGGGAPGDHLVSMSAPRSAVNVLVTIAHDFSPRYETHRDDLVTIDVSGLERLLGPPLVIGDELRRAAAVRGVRLHTAIAGTWTAAMVLAQSRPGLTIVEAGREADALASIPIRILETFNDDGTQSSRSSQRNFDQHSASSACSAFSRWGINTLGDVAALPAADLVARLGRAALAWQAVARGADVRPLVPSLPEERFESTMELEWPIEGLEPLSFVLTRLLEPLSARLEKRDRGAAALHIVLRLVSHEAAGAGRVVHARRLDLPAPMRDVRALRTLALLDLESHPPDAPIDRVTIVIDPTPGRVLQHRLFTRAQPTPEQLTTLLARVAAVMGQDRLGAPATVDTYRPGAFTMTPFAAGHPNDVERRTRKARREDVSENSANSAISALNVVSALRRLRHPVPARVAVADGRPLRGTTDPRGIAGGAVVHCAGPWSSSGNWWAAGPRAAREVPSPVEAGAAPTAYQPRLAHLTDFTYWARDEWDVSLADGAIYRIFRDRDTDGWFIDGIVD